MSGSNISARATWPRSSRASTSIPERLIEVWDESDRTGDPESEVADRIAQRLIGRG